ncbi:helix-turn-helix domain-containing protein [Ruicaihuangia caeni]|uniref:Helix-turn-helix domain-containing protein n=1 Tax=Ruicaihuangia caeni TaxID=3042517 RepID=A0AAW6T6P5_9MICO|nr:helix-turn-helix domain-containing protein [Klugiella sp. YN-L-19]MDI2099457.1 helix-turn-helix domain-containing protein [Klugiella sp. YN-L-19]
MTASNSARDRERFLTPTDAAEVLNVPVDDVFDAMQSGELPAIRVGGHWRIEHDRLERFIEGRYEETRRMALWQQAELADVVELFDHYPRTTTT